MTDFFALNQACMSGSDPSACSNPDLQAFQQILNACQSGSDPSACSNPDVQAFQSASAGPSFPAGPSSPSLEQTVSDGVDSLIVLVISTAVVLLAVTHFSSAIKHIFRLIRPR